MVICSHCYTYLTFFFFNDTATTEIYTLSLHDALPIWLRALRRLLRQHGAPLRHHLAPRCLYREPEEEAPYRRRGPRGPSRGRAGADPWRRGARRPGALELDRKSTRLNSSHANISYAVF